MIGITKCKKIVIRHWYRFDGWAFREGKIRYEIRLTLRRMVDIIYDGLRQEGKHDFVSDWLGVSILEDAVIIASLTYTKAIRKYQNP